MARLYNFLGQEVVFGDIVGDICLYSTRLGYDSPGTYFDPIKYAEDHGGIPTSNHTYYFYDESTGDQDPVFGIYFIYSGNKFRVGYITRFFDTGTGTWNPYTGNPLIMPWFDRYEGADPNNITNDDRFKNGLYFTYINIASDPGAGRFTVGKIGYTLGHETDVGIAVEYPGTCTYELDDHIQNPNYETYKLTGGDSYSMFAYNGMQIAFPDHGGEWMATLATPINDFDEDDSEPAGGGGSYDFHSDPLGFSDLPGISIIDSGIATMWTPSPAQIQGLVNFLWSDDFFDNIIKLVADPLENIIQFGIVPFSLDNYKGTAKDVMIGNVNSEVVMTPLTRQYIHVSLGSVKIPEAWGTVMDYEPNTKISIFVPYVGVFDMVASEVMNADSVELAYNIDLLSGDFIAEIKVNKHYPKGVHLNGLVYHKAGNLMTKLPLTGANYGRMYPSMLSGVAQTISGVGAGSLGSVAGGVANTLISSFSVPVERTGAYTGSAAMMGCEIPHIILSQPVQVKPARYNEYEGFASYITYKLSNLSGFTKCESVIDNTVSAPDDEKAEIERLLKEGVIL